MTRRLAPALVLVCAALALPGTADASSLPAGRLFGLGCIKAPADPQSCEITLYPRLDSGEGVAASRDGRYVWAGGADGVLWVFRRDAAGRLSPYVCQDDGSRCPAADPIAHLLSVDGLAASPDGHDLYAIDVGSPGSGTLHVLHVLPDGRLSDGGCFDVGSVCGAGNSVPALANAGDVTVSKDGASVYVASGSGTDAVAIFDRAANGSLTYAGCVSTPALCGPGNTGPGLEGANGVDVSADGTTVYVASIGPTFGGATDGSVAWMTRNVDGSLEPPSTVSGPGLVDPFDLVATSKDVYVVSRDGLDGSQSAVVRLRREAGGALSYRSCFAFTGSAQCGAGRAIPGIRNAYDIAMAPDGTTVHTTALGGPGTDDGAVATFTRASTGVLSPAGCLGQSNSSETGCTRSRVIENGGEAIDVPPDGDNVYAGTGGGLAYLGREKRPTCRSATAVVPGRTTVLAVPCSDANEDALARFAVAGPAHGELGTFDDTAGTVRYSPTPGYVGPDAFTFRATAGSLTSNLATLLIDVRNVRPRVTRLGLSRKRFRRGRRLPTASRKAKVGTRIRFRLSEPASVRLSFERILSGRRVGRRCKAPRRRLRSHRRCRRYRRVRVGIRVRGDRGRNSVRFQGRLSRRRRLGAGSYRLTVVAKDKQGLRSRRKRASFRLLR